jgi:hypothetical protein
MSKTRACMCKSGKFLQFKGVAVSGPGANGTGTVYSVVVTRRLIHGGGYLSDCIRKFLSL